MTSVDDQLNDAKAAAARDRDAVAALSAKRLIELQQQSPRAAAQYWEDPALTQKDRQAFLSWLRSKLSGQRPSNSMRRRVPLSPIWQTLRRHWRLVCLASAVVAVLGTAAWNTPRIYWAQVITDTIVEWHLDGAVAGYQTLSRGTNIAIIGQYADGTIVARQWLNRRGYMTGTLPANAVQFYP